jgi:hypothetical protein
MHVYVHACARATLSHSLLTILRGAVVRVVCGKYRARAGDAPDTPDAHDLQGALFFEYHNKTEVNRSNFGLTNNVGCTGRVRGRGDPRPVRTGSDRALRGYPRSTSKSCLRQSGPRAVFLNLGLGKREFEDTGTQTRSAFFKSTFQTFGFQGAELCYLYPGLVNCMMWRTGSRNEPAGVCDGRSGGHAEFED